MEVSAAFCLADQKRNPNCQGAILLEALLASISSGQEDLRSEHFSLAVKERSNNNNH